MIQRWIIIMQPQRNLEIWKEQAASSEPCHGPCNLHKTAYFFTSTHDQNYGRKGLGEKVGSPERVVKLAFFMG